MSAPPIQAVSLSLTLSFPLPSRQETPQTPLNDASIAEIRTIQLPQGKIQDGRRFEHVARAQKQKHEKGEICRSLLRKMYLKKVSSFPYKTGATTTDCQPQVGPAWVGCSCCYRHSRRGCVLTSLAHWVSQVVLSSPRPLVEVQRLEQWLRW